MRFGTFQYTVMDIFYCIGDFIFAVCKFEFLIWKQCSLINIEICNGEKGKYLNGVKEKEKYLKEKYRNEEKSDMILEISTQ